MEKLFDRFENFTYQRGTDQTQVISLSNYI